MNVPHNIFIFYGRKNEFFSFSEVQSDRASLHLFDGSGLLRDFSSRCMSCYNQDATIRPVLKHGPRSSTGLQIIEFLYSKLIWCSESVICVNCLSNKQCHTCCLCTWNAEFLLNRAHAITFNLG